MKNRIINILILIIYAIIVNGQVNGRVLNSSTDEAISGVELLVPSLDKIVITNRDGAFAIDTENGIGLELICFKSGYDVLEFRVDTLSDNYTIRLNKLSIELSDIEVIRKRKEIFATKKLADIDGTSIYAGKKTEVILIDLIRGNTAANVSRQVFAQVSGLNIYEGSAGGLQLNIGGRGLDPNRTSNFNTRQNGYDISADVLGYPESYYTPPIDALEEIRILRGASSLQYGTQFGGLIDFRIRQIPSYRRWDIKSKQTYGSFKFFNSFNSVAYSNKRFSFDSFYNYKQGDGYRNNSEFRVNNAFLSARYRISDRTNLSFDFTYYNYLAKQAGGLTDIQFASNPRTSTRDRNWFSVDWQLYNLKLFHNFSDDEKMELSLFGLKAKRKSVGYRGNPITLNENPILGIDEQDINGHYISPRDLIIGQFRNVGAEFKYINDHQIADMSSTLLLGIKIYKSDNSSLQGPGSKGTDADFGLQTSIYPDYPNQSNFDFPNFNAALFGEQIFYVNDRLSITPGFRLEYIKTRSEGSYQQVIFDLADNPIAKNIFEESRVLPRGFLLAGIGVDYKYSEAFNYRINVSQNYRSVTFSDLRIINPTFIVDENISDEKGLSFSTGITGKSKSKFYYDIGFYTLFYNNRIGISLDDRANRERTNIGSAIILGTESLFNIILYRLIKEDKKVFQINTFLNSSFTYSKYLNALNNNVMGKTVEFVPSVIIKSGISMEYKKLSVSVQFSNTSAQFTDAQNSLATINNDLRAGIIGQIPSYRIFDWAIGYSFDNIKLEGGINNVLNEAYYTRRATGYPGPGIIPSDGRSFYITMGYVFQE